MVLTGCEPGVPVDDEGTGGVCHDQPRTRGIGKSDGQCSSDGYALAVQNQGGSRLNKQIVSRLREYQRGSRCPYLARDVRGWNVVGTAGDDRQFAGVVDAQTTGLAEYTTGRHGHLSGNVDVAAETDPRPVGDVDVAEPRGARTRVQEGHGLWFGAVECHLRAGGSKGQA